MALIFCTLHHDPSRGYFLANRSHACGESVGLLLVFMQTNCLELNKYYSRLVWSHGLGLPCSRLVIIRM